MRAIVVREWVHPSELRVEEVPEPALTPGCVKVDIHCAGVNFFDILLVQGKYQVQPAFPFVPGSEFAGVIIEAAPDVTGFRVGDRVFGGSMLGAYAERTVVPVEAIRRMPEDSTFEEACGWFVTLPTAYAGLVLRGGLRAGETCVVTGASGGVGLAAMQIARALGARVIAITSKTEKAAALREAGAHDVVDSASTPDWPREVQALTDAHGADVIFDTVGFGVEATKCIAWNGRHVIVGFAGGKIPSLPLNRVLLKNMSVGATDGDTPFPHDFEACVLLRRGPPAVVQLTGVQWGAYQFNDPAAVEPVWEGIETLLRSHKIATLVYKYRFWLEDLPTALRHLQEQRVLGKAVIHVQRRRREEYDAGAARPRL